MRKEIFDKFYNKYSKERDEINEVIQKQVAQISNLKKSIEEGIAFSSKLATIWTSSPVSTKEKLQKLIFPEGIIYSKKNEVFRTENVNSFFALIADAANGSGENKKGTNKVLHCLSPSAEKEGFEHLVKWPRLDSNYKIIRAANFESAVFIDRNRFGFEPMTYCLEGSCSIGYKTYQERLG